MGQGCGAGGDVVDDLAVVAVEDGAGEPLAGGLGCGGAAGGVGSGGVEVEEIGGVVVTVNVIVVVAVVGAEEGVVEPIGVRIGGGFVGGVRGEVVGKYGVVGKRVVGVGVVVVGRLRLLLVCEMVVEWDVLGEVVVMVRHNMCDIINHK